ncbi:TraB/GumN family protein [Psychroserpens sp. SPM9]|uniref:TraB/GumN family protein n=1 Tax=Psychroserpens sp. SPM9 TaxID=2975598 RepID=UPI0021A2EF49|nr:TraB/GumN family protein [Psychroserpens sp. SPM9]MDG5491743.1 TraB/GumN family protein [Psychroserpens sp. SPM9]
MKNLLCALAFSLTGFFSLQAQELDKALLWEISGNGLTEASYLYGTIHMTCDASLDQNILKALDQTKLLVLELDMDDPSMQMTMMKGLYMKDQKTLKDLVTEEEYATIATFVKEQIGMPIDALANIKPFFITAMFYPKLLGCPVQSFEAALMKVAHEQKEEVLGLETVAEQLQVFDEIPYEDQAADLLRSAEDQLAKDKASFKKLLDLYNSKDIEGMIKMMEEDKELSTSKHSDKMLDNRNKNWIEKISEFAKEQPTFFGVGAAHLAGENGVIKLLRKAGYTVKAVR